MSILDKINQPNDIKKISPGEYDALADELRQFLISHISNTGGHLAANLGVVELTMALHLFLDFPKDKLVWDVGHQSYVHKILTGRKDKFNSLRQFQGLSGYPKRLESECDAFDTGHSSTSISAALGYVKVRDLKKEKQKIIAVIGDGALSGGMAYEAMNNAGGLKSNMIIVLNDNNMSISENVGSIAGYLGKIRTNKAYVNFKGELETALSKLPKVGNTITRTLKRSKDSIKQLVVPGMLFENMGLTYIGPIDGHNINQIQLALQHAAQKNNATLVHVITQKGKGFAAAENNPSKYHGVEPFDAVTGKSLKTKKEPTYTDVFGSCIVELAKKNEKIVAVSAAMESGTGLSSFAKAFPDRFFDVGIAEEHAVTFAAGIAAAGYRPVVALYSTFLQRAYDQILHDVCLGNLPVLFAIDRAGIVGNDGETHQGIFDISFLSHIPGMTLLAPKNDLELKEMLAFAFQLNQPVAIRYPRLQAYTGLRDQQSPLEYGKSEVLFEDENAKLAIFAAGSMVENAVHVKTILEQKGIKSTVINVRFLAPFDTDAINKYAEKCDTIVTIEENVKRGGFGEAVSAFLLENLHHKVKHINISLPNQFLIHGCVDQLREYCNLDAANIARTILDGIKEKE